MRGKISAIVRSCLGGWSSNWSASSGRRGQPDRLFTYHVNNYSINMELQGNLTLYYLCAKQYLQYVCRVFFVLLQTFPFNVMAMLAFFVLIFRGMRKGRRDVVHMVRKVRREMEGGRGQLGRAEVKREETMVEVRKAREKLSKIQVMGFDRNLVEDLAREEREIYEGYLELEEEKRRL